MGFNELGNRLGVLQYCQRLLERLEILRTDQDRGWRPIASDYYTFVVGLHTLNELREAISNSSQRRARHGHNCATSSAQIEGGIPG